VTWTGNWGTGTSGYRHDDCAHEVTADSPAMTAGCTINVLAPVVGERLLARASVTSSGQWLIVTRCELFEPRPDGDRLCAIAQGTIARTT
jgi:acyl-coenzyme A thioesterase PaaI-like protein